MQEQPPPGTRGRCDIHDKWIYRTRREGEHAAVGMIRRENRPFSVYRANQCGEWHVGKPRFGDDTYPEAYARWIVHQGRTALDRSLTTAERKRAREIADVLVRIEAARKVPDPDLRYTLMALPILIPGFRLDPKVQLWADMQNPDYRTRLTIVREQEAARRARIAAGQETEEDRLHEQLFGHRERDPDLTELEERLERMFGTSGE